MLDWPLTRQIIERSHQRRIFTLLSTNCTLVTPQIAAELVGCGLDHLVCAIDGITQESYQMYRVGGDVQVALEALKTIVEERKRQRSSTFVEWQFLVHGHNAEEVQQAKLLAKTLGVHIRFAPLRGMEWDAGLQRYWWNAGSAPIAEKVPQEGRVSLRLAVLFSVALARSQFEREGCTMSALSERRAIR